MIPGNKGTMMERMEQASLNELMPGFDKDEEWAKLSGKLTGNKVRPVRLSLMRAAAAVLLLAGGSMAGWYMLHSNAQPQLAQAGTTAHFSAPAITASAAPAAVATDHSTIAVNNDTGYAGVQQPAVQAKTKKYAQLSQPAKIKDGRPERYYNYYQANEFVRNGTSCPLEICVVQTFKCRNAKPRAVASCNTLQPEESGLLRYKAQDKKGNDCKVTVDEVRIKRVATGETIVLNAASKPATAQELISCITGPNECKVLAGIFDEDCNSSCMPHNLTIYNNDGSLILQ